MTIDEELDTTGLLCPLPVLKAAKRMRALAPGSVLRMHADDPAGAGLDEVIEQALRRVADRGSCTDRREGRKNDRRHEPRDGHSLPPAFSARTR